MTDAKVTSKGQVTIPKDVRDRLGVDRGDYLRFVVREDGTAYIEALDAEARERGLAGILNDRIGPDVTLDLARLARAMEEAVAAHVLRPLQRSDR